MTRIRAISLIGLMYVVALIQAGEFTVELLKNNDDNNENLRQKRNLRSTFYGIGTEKESNNNEVSTANTVKLSSTTIGNLFHNENEQQQNYFIGKKTSTTTTSRCSTSKDDECCVDQDCQHHSSNNICVNRHCIDEGYPRFTLEWHGYNDRQSRI